MTLRAAVDALVVEGLLERRHGAGTFVAFRPVLRMLGLTSFSQDMRSRGLDPSSRVLDFRTIDADATLAERLQIPTGVARLHDHETAARQRRADGDRERAHPGRLRART